MFDLDSDAIDVNETDDVYHATRMTPEEVEQINELWKKNDEKLVDVEPYQAIRNDDCMETDLREPYRAIHNIDMSSEVDDVDSSDDVSEMTSSETLEEKFMTDVENMSFDDLKLEQDRLDELSQMDDLDIFKEYDEVQKESYDSELFDSLTDGLPREALEYLKEGLENGNQAVYEYFGMRNDEDGEDSDTTVDFNLSKRR